MEIKLNDELTLTTNHPMSSYGLGVVVSESGKAYMPSDSFPIPAPLKIALGDQNKDRTMAEAIVQMVSQANEPLKLSAAELQQIRKYLSQHPDPSETERLPSAKELADRLILRIQSLFQNSEDIFGMGIKPSEEDQIRSVANLAIEFVERHQPSFLDR